MSRAAAALGLLFVASCAALPEPDLAMAGGDPAALEELRAGRNLYVDKCSGCHAPVDPRRHADAEWPPEVDEMVARKRIRLGPGQRDLLLRYLSTANGRD